MNSIQVVSSYPLAERIRGPQAFWNCKNARTFSLFNSSNVNDLLLLLLKQNI